tara:strand:- start:187 stop:555 length:369 start_codon:yes stop_codon:yes gene_type:complete
MFVGDETDAHIAGELYRIMLSSLRKFTRQACGKGWSRYHTDYALGFGVRVVDRAKTEALKSKESSQSMALVVTKKDEALTKYMDKLGLVNAKTRNRTYSQEYNRGYQDGSKMNLSFDKNLKQ